MVKHAESCPVCSELLADSGAAARALSELPQADAVPNLDAVLATVTASIESERGVTGTLRALPTRARRLLAIALSLITALVTFLLIPRADLAVYPMPRMALVVTMLLVTLAAAVRLSLWPLQVTLPSPRTTFAVLALAIVAPIVCASLPAAHWAHHASMLGAHGDLVNRAFHCFAAGLALGMPLLLLLRALDRNAHTVTRSALVAAAATGLSANLALQLHCPLTHPWHLLLGHATIGIAAMVAYGALVHRRRS